MGGKSRKSGGVSERLIKRIKRGDFNDSEKRKKGDKKIEKGFGFGISEDSSRTTNNS